MKKYKFFFRKKPAKIFLNSHSAFMNFGFPLLIFVLVNTVVNNLNLYFYSWYIIYYIVALTLSFSIGIAGLVYYCVSFKGIIIKEDSIQFCRRYVDSFQLFKMKISVPLDRIVDCSIVSTFSLSFDEIMFCRMGGADREYIKIVLDNGMPYFFAVENKEEVYQEILNRINNADDKLAVEE